MKRLLIASTTSSLLLVRCGLSSKEKKAYESEINLFQSYVDDSSHIDKAYNQMIRYKNEGSMYGMETFGAWWEELLEERDLREDYISCLKRYKDIKEPFAKARTACIAETGIDR
tara:strand:- start:1550 stop:1891 length:342 start_codon:yes stop_codon:yes gene_type:complete